MDRMILVSFACISLVGRQRKLNIVQIASVTLAISVDWVITTVDTVAAEIQKRTNGKGIVNESPIWSSLLGKACDGAETEVIEIYRKSAFLLMRNFPIVVAGTFPRCPQRRS
jgi:hypothetical protein